MKHTHHAIIHACIASVALAANHFQLAVLKAALCAPFAPSTAAAQNADAARSQAGSAPRLGMPLGGERIDARSGVLVVFVWSPPSPVPGVPPPQRYRLCLVAGGTSCTAPGAIVYDAGASTRFEAAVPPALVGQLLAWSVAACGPGYGTTAGGGVDECSWAPFRTFDTRTAIAEAGGEAAARDSGLRAAVSPASLGSGGRSGGGLPPRLGTPSARDVIRMHASSATPVTFVWSPPPSTAESAAGSPPPQRYRLCIRELSVSCDSPSALVHDVGPATVHDAQLPASFYGKQVAWTVAACGPGYGSGGGGRDADCAWAPAIMLDTVSSSGAPFGQ